MNSLNKTYKELAIPYFKECFDCIDEVMKELDIPYYLIGASAISLELLNNGIKPSRGTKDIDFAVMISTIGEYEELSKLLETRGFNKVSAPWTFYSEKFNIAVDILPFGEIEEKYTVNFNERRIDLHVLGFKEVMEEAVPVYIEEKIANIPALPGMVILKLISWSDRPEERIDDLYDILKIIEHYYELEWDDILENHYDLLDKDPFDQKIIAAEVLGRKSKLYLDKSKALSERIIKLLNTSLQDPLNSDIARIWARKIDSDIEYTIELIKAFKRGVTQ
ncbi:MAG: hypothetical protein GX154_03915 [Clostridiales bacterium]|nr:hypothetical protein [Clostridiales bacterium]